MRTIICLGNDLRGDDGAGPLVARRLYEHGTPALMRTPDALVTGWDGADDVVVIDAVRSGAAVGTIHRVDARREALPAGFASASTHLLGLAEAVELARRTGRLPAAIEIIGIEARTFELGAAMSPEVERAAERVVGELASA